MRRKEATCQDCYQEAVCGMVNQPFFLSGDINPTDAPPEACFFHCCRAGVLAAATNLRSAQKEDKFGLVPFGSDHKPFIENEIIQGRLVMSEESSGGRNGDVFVRTKKYGLVRLTNIFENKPPKN